ncbi:hypothetical protein OAC94_00880 [Gammaproteobacteria bacterium]|nr:hypothetical protein [Gammaproteobacteria bacterium]
MIKRLSFCLLAMSFTLTAAHHEGGEDHADMPKNSLVYISTYTMPAGGNMEALKKSLKTNIATLEKDGYNSCGMLQHQFGGDRAFMTYCNFDSWEQFAEINDQESTPIVGSKQLFGDHTDKLAAVVERNLTKLSAYVLEAKYSFGPYLTDNEKRANARLLFEAYDSSFGGCNLTEHFWGPEMTWNIYCGYESYAEFAVKAKALSVIHEDELADMKLDVLTHSDHLWTRVSQ